MHFLQTNLIFTFLIIVAIFQFNSYNMSALITYLQKTKKHIILTFRFYFWRIPFRFSEHCQQRHTRNQPGNQKTRNPLENLELDEISAQFQVFSIFSLSRTDKALEDNFHMRRGGYNEKIAALFICPTDWLNFFFGGGPYFVCIWKESLQ